MHRYLYGGRWDEAFIFDENLSFSDQISALSKSCYHHIHALRCIRPYLNLHTAKTIATSIGHSKLDYCNSLYYGLTKYQINRLWHIQNALARTVVKAPKFQHITPILKFLHWLKVSERIEYKIISLTYKILNTTQPPYLYDLVSIQPPHGNNTCSSPYVTLIKPSSLLKVTHRSFWHASPHLWNQLPTSLRIPHSNYSSPSQRPSFEHASLTCYTLLSPSITFSLWARNLPVQKILFSTLVCFCLSDWSHGSRPFETLTCSSVFMF